MFKGMSWTSVALSFVLYSIVFLAVRYGMVINGSPWAKAQPGLLMFTLPGAIAALTTKDHPLTVALFGAIPGALFCFGILHYFSLHHCCFLQELAFDTSAVFWCGSGALGVMLCRTLFWHEHT
ncbi:inner membrane protein YbjM [Erwinia sp. BNK-24-b]|uniref:inner membrane protein YbjM n=1 Tax=Erwinia TaxID=551 RepID=UPI001FF0765E|nr:inner membrane protein YbjM [Erwinia phyllosphaerae]